MIIGQIGRKQKNIGKLRRKESFERRGCIGSEDFRTRFTVDENSLAVSGRAGLVGRLAGVVAHVLQVERLDRQHRVEVVKGENLDVVADDGGAVFQPGNVQRSVALGHGARDGHPLTPLQQRHRRERDYLRRH